jgi:hypothetical protein
MPDFNTEYIIGLRTKVRKAYSFKHKDDPSKLDALNEVGNSHKNAFLDNLKKDLVEQTGDLNVLSISWLKNFFFKEELTNYNKSYILRLEEYCRKNRKNRKNNKLVLLLILVSAVLLTVLLLLWTFGIFSDKSHEEIIVDSRKKIYNGCVFGNNELNHNILVLPFKDIKGNSSRNDIGFVISRRLDSLGKKDSLNFIVKFCDSILPTDYDISYYKELKSNYNADHIIYGFANSDCSQSRDLICFNYITDYESPNQRIKSNFTDNTYSNFKVAGLAQLGEGYLQENLDYLIYYNAAIGAYGNGNFQKAINYSNLLLQLPIASADVDRAKIYLTLANSYESLFKDEIALDYLQKLASIESPYRYFAYLQLGYTYATFDQTELALTFLKQSIDERATFEAFNLLYALNIRIEDHRSNLFLMNKALQFFPENKKLLYNRAYSKKMLGDDDGFKNDSQLALHNVKNDSQMNIITANPKVTEVWLDQLSYTKFLGLHQKIIREQGENIDPDSLRKYIQRIKTFYRKDFYDQIHYWDKWLIDSVNNSKTLDFKFE